MSATCRSVGSSITRNWRTPPPGGKPPPPGKPPSSNASAPSCCRVQTICVGFVGAEADRVHAHPAVGGLLGGVDRLDAPRVGAVGEQHDDVGHVAARVRRRGRRRFRARCRPASGAEPVVSPDTSDPTGATFGFTAAMASSALQRRRPDDRAARRREVVDGVGQLAPCRWWAARPARRSRRRRRCRCACPRPGP